MKVIITGGTGLVGTELTADLIRDGHEVIILSRAPETYGKKQLQGIRVEKWDAKTADGWGHLADGADVIVNLAGANVGEGRWTPERKKIIIDSRVNAGKAVVEAVSKARQKPALVIQSSGVDYYGVHGEEMINENHPKGEGFLSDVTQVWEDATLPVEEFGVRRVVYRGAPVLSLKGGAFPRILLPFRLFAGGPLGSGKQWFSWIHMRDQIAALRFFIDHPETSGVYNVSAPVPIQNRELARTIGSVMKRPAFFPVPAFMIRLLFGEMAVTVLGGQRVIPDRLEKAGFHFMFPKIEQAVQDLVG